MPPCDGLIARLRARLGREERGAGAQGSSRRWNHRVARVVDTLVRLRCAAVDVAPWGLYQTPGVNK
jgi:hypothetical protein